MLIVSLRERETVNKETGNATNTQHQEVASLGLSKLDNQGAVLTRVQTSTFMFSLARQW